MYFALCSIIEHLQYRLILTICWVAHCLVDIVDTVVEHWQFTLRWID